MERYLQMSDEPPDKIPADMTLDTRTQIQEANWQICNVTTPANYFHLLRRQVHREFRKPLIVISPKNLLRHPKCVSPLSDFDDEEASQTEQGIRFKRLIMDKTATSRNKVDPPLEPNAKRVVFCTGKVYYELDAEREAMQREDDVKIVRIEQLSPFPWDLVDRELRRYPNAEPVWCQEEPMNMGAWAHISPRFQTLFKEKHINRPLDALKYAGRAPAASPSTGYGLVHAEEQVGLVKEALMAD
jgi:2-oxoglutarate dehydrogenase E1 component